MKNIFLVTLIIISYFGIAQNKDQDSLKTTELKEIILIGKKALIHEKEVKSLATIDEFLQQSVKVDMIKRGAYAWEPIINNMPTERTLVTIDGMRVFGACTDKMDPITSYIEITNLSEAEICSGQEGSCFGNTIGGSVDLKRNKTSFGKKKWELGIQTGYETNNKQKILGASYNFKNNYFYADFDVMHRNADNYVAGNQKKVLFSQFSKTNFSNTFGFKISDSKFIETSLIYDKATDIGYPALPMDVSLAEALITSLKYEYKPLNSNIKLWETKVYYNTIEHKMDDTTRPNVPVHMDMPGWSKTIGYYSKFQYQFKNHDLIINPNSFFNNSIAEMTMYPNDPNENLMFMFTWPDVDSFYNGIYLEDNYSFSCHSSLKLSATLGSHSNKITNAFGLSSLQIFYPEMEAQKNRILKSFGSKYSVSNNLFDYSFGLAYSERAPSVSEGYGFYLFNSFDGFDNIGNPNLNNERALEGNINFGFKNEWIKLNATASYFKIYDYILAKTDPTLIPMTIGANGVRIYNAIEFATIFNTSLSSEIIWNENFKWNSQISYARAKDNANQNLPFISPLGYQSAIRYHINKLKSEISVFGNATQTNYNGSFGEDKTPSFAILNFNLGYIFKYNSMQWNSKFGIENILDKNYSTYTDWNNIPRMGRNFYLNLTYQLY